MRRLLADMPDGVPAECLVARLRGRGSLLLTDRDPVLVSGAAPTSLPAAPWRSGAFCDDPEWPRYALHAEYRWVYARMPEPVRCILSPLFWVGEIGTVAVSLRRRAAGWEPDERLLRASLLGDGLKRFITASPSAVAMAGALSQELVPYHPGFRDLEAAFASGGAAAVEAALYDVSLQHLAATVPDPTVSRFLRLLIDWRNLSGLGKHLRWNVGTPPPLLSGGTVPLSRLRQLFHRHDLQQIGDAAAGLGTSRTADATGSIEHAAILAIGTAVRRMARTMEQVPVILDYLWRCTVEARNLCLLTRVSVAGAELADDILP